MMTIFWIVFVYNFFVAGSFVLASIAFIASILNYASMIKYKPEQTEGDENK